jgi:hypothetical protein
MKTKVGVNLFGNWTPRGVFGSTKKESMKKMLEKSR